MQARQTKQKQTERERDHKRCVKVAREWKREKERVVSSLSLVSLCYLPKSASLGSCVVFGVLGASFIGELSELRLPSEDNDGGGE